MRIITYILFGLMICGVFLYQPLLASAAYDPFGGVDCGAGQNADSAACSSRTSNDPISGKNGALTKISNIIAFIAGAAAIIVIIVSGIRYITSSGDSNKITSAKNTLVYAVLGLTFIALARALIAFIVTKL